MTEASSLRDLDYVIPLIISFSHPFLFPSLASTPAAPPHQRAARVVLRVGVASYLLWAGAVTHGGGEEANARTNGIVAKHEGHHCNMSG